MFSYVGVEDCVVKIGGNQQLYCFGVVVWCGGFYYCVDWLIVIFGDLYFMLVFVQCWGVDQIVVFKQIVIIVVGR